MKEKRQEKNSFWQRHNVEIIVWSAFAFLVLAGAAGIGGAVAYERSDSYYRKQAEELPTSFYESLGNYKTRIGIYDERDYSFDFGPEGFEEKLRSLNLSDHDLGEEGYWTGEEIWVSFHFEEGGNYRPMLTLLKSNPEIAILNWEQTSDDFLGSRYSRYYRFHCDPEVSSSLLKSCLLMLPKYQS